MKTLKVGIASYEDFKARTMAIARGELKPAAGEPKIWFSSIESLAKVLSERNRELLAMIADSGPSSMHELAEKSGRALSNLSRTLKTMERYGLVQFEKGAGRTRLAKVMYTDIEFGLPLRGAHRPAALTKRAPAKRGATTRQ